MDGKIAYEIKGPLGPIVNCHCSKCRKWHGAAFRTRCTVESKNFILRINLKTRQNN
ncbi:GFA family protein [Legionella busanensis]|uniref:GFA family protein n=1 Tax=Legionella busanensis TaxID=190655 RepID=UPI000E1B770A